MVNGKLVESGDKKTERSSAVVAEERRQLEDHEESPCVVLCTYI